MKASLLLTLLFTVFLPSAQASDQVTPTGLTIVVCDSTNKVLDSVVVPDDQHSRTVKFLLPKEADEIRVFALGERLHKDLSTNYYITGRPNNENWMGMGYVEAHLDKGILVGIDGNGFGPLKIDDALKKQIKADIEAGKPAAITTVETLRQGSAGQPATRPESKTEAGDKPQSESEGRSR